MQNAGMVVSNNPASEQVYQFEKCEVILWKDGLVTITSPESKSPVISFRRAPNPWCGRD
jgi:hypothetical protein